MPSGSAYDTFSNEGFGNKSLSCQKRSIPEVGSTPQRKLKSNPSRRVGRYFSGRDVICSHPPPFYVRSGMAVSGKQRENIHQNYSTKVEAAINHLVNMHL
ncbi:hypothetical protein GH733_010447 [Mirounga leonina]|nr:hypothetical protein GH733_010447 [Mirounga leonina]